MASLGVTADASSTSAGVQGRGSSRWTRDAPSHEMEETSLGAILDQRYATMVYVIAKDRGLDAAAVKDLIDRGLFTSDQAKAAKLVDYVVPFDRFRDAVKAPWNTLERSNERSTTSSASYLQLAAVHRRDADRIGLTGDHVAVDLRDRQHRRRRRRRRARRKRDEIAANTLVAALSRARRRRAR